MIYQNTEDEISRLRVSGKINAQIHHVVMNYLQPGISTAELNDVAQQVLAAAGARSSFYGYRGFPSDICVSVNEETGHGVPGQRKLCADDVVKIDVGVEYEGMHTDAACTHIVGKGTLTAARLVHTTETALWEGIRKASIGRCVSDISSAITNCVQREGFQVIRKALGHGVGRALHEDPQIPSFGPGGLGPKLREGMCIAIEPIVTAGLPYVKKSNTADISVDGALTAHFEHTILLTKDGPEILTAWSEPSSVKRTVLLEDISVREFSPADSKSVLVELAAAEMDEYLLKAWGRRVHPHDLFGDTSSHIRLLETTDGELAGFFIYSLQPRTLHLNTIVHAAKYQGRGLGHAVMNFLTDVAAHTGRDRLELSVQTTNPKAIRFYERLGFSVVRCYQTNTLYMRKNLI